MVCVPLTCGGRLTTALPRMDSLGLDMRHKTVEIQIKLAPEHLIQCRISAKVFETVLNLCTFPYIAAKLTQNRGFLVIVYNALVYKMARGAKMCSTCCWKIGSRLAATSPRLSNQMSKESQEYAEMGTCTNCYTNTVVLRDLVIFQ